MKDKNLITFKGVAESKEELQKILVEMYPQPNYVWSYLNPVVDGLYPDEVIRRAGKEENER